MGVELNRSCRRLGAPLLAALIVVAVSGCSQDASSRSDSAVAPQEATSASAAPRESPDARATTATDSESPSASSSTAAAAYAVTAGEAPCSVRSLSARETGGGSVMNQPWSIVTLTNTGSRACTLDGYPVVDAAWTARGRYPVSVLDAGIFEVVDPGPTRFSVPPGAHAWFAAGTGMSYLGPLLAFTEIAFATTRGTSVAQSVRVRVDLDATGRAGAPYGVIVTAFAPGTGPRP